MKNLKLCAQDAYLALYPQSKKPVGVNWSDEGTSQEQALATNGNLGLLLGPKSDVIDVDLDCREAKCLAQLILPKPFAQFDRGTSDSGHYLYKAITCGPTKKFSGNSPKSTLVELRGDGSQTMIPPSIHPDGSRLNFTDINQDAPLHVSHLCCTMRPYLPAHLWLHQYQLNDQRVTLELNYGVMLF